MLTNYERVTAAISHKEIGHVPYSFSFCTAVDRYRDKLYNDYITGSARILYEKGLLNYAEALTFGTGGAVFEVSPPWWGWYKSGEDGFGHPDTPTTLPRTMGWGDYGAFVEKVQLLKELTGGYVLCSIYGSHFEKANGARGIENFLADIGGEPEYARHMLNTIIEKNMVMLANIVDIPEIDGILLGSDWGTQLSLLMSPTVWRDMIKPGEQREYDLIKSRGKHVWIHSCGQIMDVLPDLCEMGVDVLNPLQAECMDISEVKAKFGDKLSFWGGIGTQRVLPYGTAAEVAAETRRVIGIMSKGGGYITNTSQGILDEVPYENITAMIDAAREFI